MGEEPQILLTRLVEGNHLAFASIYKKYARQAYTLAFKYLGSKELAEDAVQNLFLKLWRNRAEIDTSRDIAHLIFRMLKNDLLNTLRDSRNEVFVLDNCLEVLNMIDGADAEIQQLRQDQVEIFKQAIKRLSPQRRKIFTLKITGNYSNQEIADMLHLSVNTIKFQYSQSLKQVKAFARECAIAAIVTSQFWWT